MKTVSQQTINAVFCLKRKRSILSDKYHIKYLWEKTHFPGFNGARIFFLYLIILVQISLNAVHLQKSFLVFLVKVLTKFASHNTIKRKITFIETWTTHIYIKYTYSKIYLFLCFFSIAS